MQESLLESLSAAVDGEAEELELRRVLNAARDDAELRAKWTRLHEIGAAIRASPAHGALPAPASTASAAWQPPWLTDAEAPRRAEPAPSSEGRLKWLAPLTGVGVAAAAALTVVVFFGSAGDMENPAPADIMAEAGDPASNAAEPAADWESATGLAQVPSEQDLRRANAYMVHHAQQTSLTTRPPGMPFVKVLSTTGDGVAAPPEGMEADR